MLILDRLKKLYVPVCEEVLHSSQLQLTVGYTMDIYRVVVSKGISTGILLLHAVVVQRGRAPP
jgi:hypothetical protein